MGERRPERALVALSGGVDSSVAAALLQEQGTDLAAVTLKTFCYAGLSAGPKNCCGLEGVEAARAAAGRLGIPHFILDVSEMFKREVIEAFITEYAAGRTPNPCVQCNATVKIPYLLEKARSMGYPALATGHYARILPAGNGLGLFRGMDSAKDQSYFLWKIPRDVLAGLYFPIGEMDKPNVRALAAKFGLANAKKPESQEICFVAESDYVEFLRRILPPGHPGFQPGKIVDVDGRSLGRHDGYLRFTVGQRKGLGGGHGRRLFVIEIKPDTREVVATEEREMMRKRLLIDRINVLADSADLKLPLKVQIRHRAHPIPGRIVSDPAFSLSWEIELESAARAISPGQSAVIYNEDRVVAGGRIIAAPRSY